MLAAVDGNYEDIFEFIADDPYLLTRRDFISGFSVLHWLAKSGHGETLAKLLRHAENAGSPADVNLRGSGGLTPLHVASMHGRFMVVKLLVGAFGAKVDVMDYNGRRAWQYLGGNAPLEMKELLGAWDEEHSTTQAKTLFPYTTLFRSDRQQRRSVGHAEPRAPLCGARPGRGGLSGQEHRWGSAGLVFKRRVPGVTFLGD